MSPKRGKMKVSKTLFTYEGLAIQITRNTNLGAKADINASKHPIASLPY
jgi:hypothetical protein